MSDSLHLQAAGFEDLRVVTFRVAEKQGFFSAILAVGGGTDLSSRRAHALLRAETIPR